MKAMIFAAMSLFATAALASEPVGIVPAHRATEVQVQSVNVEVTGPWAQHHVTVVAQFGNPCMVARAEELVVMSRYQDNFDALVLSLGAIGSDRVCTMEYAPVTATIDLGTYGRPNDGVFGKVVVNGVEQIVN